MIQRTSPSHWLPFIIRLFLSSLVVSSLYSRSLDYPDPHVHIMNDINCDFCHHWYITDMICKETKPSRSRRHEHRSHEHRSQQGKAAFTELTFMAIICCSDWIWLFLQVSKKSSAPVNHDVMLVTPCSNLSAFPKNFHRWKPATFTFTKPRVNTLHPLAK